MPVILAYPLFQALGATDLDGQDGASGYMPCSAWNCTTRIFFQSGAKHGPTVDVQPSDMVLDDGTFACGLPRSIPRDDACILSDVFLKFAYIVYDLRYHIAALVQTNISPDPPDIQVIPVSGNLPRVSKTAAATASVYCIGPTATAASHTRGS